MVHTRDGIAQDHGRREDGAGHDAPDVVVKRGAEDAEDQEPDGERAADDVAHHIKDLLAPGVVRKGPGVQRLTGCAQFRACSHFQGKDLLL